MTTIDLGPRPTIEVRMSIEVVL